LRPCPTNSHYNRHLPVLRAILRLDKYLRAMGSMGFSVRHYLKT
jgi:hypothetical protein